MVLKKKKILKNKIVALRLWSSTLLVCRCSFLKITCVWIQNKIKSLTQSLEDTLRERMSRTTIFRKCKFIFISQCPQLNRDLGGGRLWQMILSDGPGEQRKWIVWYMPCVWLPASKRRGLIDEDLVSLSCRNLTTFSTRGQKGAQGHLIVGSHAQIKTNVQLIQKVFSAVSIPFWRRHRRQTINLTLQSR